jgi:hypothetical protein
MKFLFIKLHAAWPVVPVKALLISDEAYSRYRFWQRPDQDAFR